MPSSYLAVSSAVTWQFLGSYLSVAVSCKKNMAQKKVGEEITHKPTYSPEL